MKKQNIVALFFMTLTAISAQADTLDPKKIVSEVRLKQAKANH